MYIYSDPLSGNLSVSWRQCAPREPAEQKRAGEVPVEFFLLPFRQKQPKDISKTDPSSPQRRQARSSGIQILGSHQRVCIMDKQ